MTECPKCNYKRQAGDIECPHCGIDFAYIEKKLAREKAEIAEKELEKERAAARLSELIDVMADDQLLNLLDYAEELYGKKKREHERYSCLITTDCVYKSRAFNDFIKDISCGGVFIETSESFLQGEDITLTISFSHYSKPFKIIGEIVRITPSGIGVKFKTVSQVQEELVQDLVEKVGKFKK
jgi:Tfp pilus assembly protein PilZ